MGTVMRASLRSGAVMTCFFFLLAPVMGATIWVESVDGDFPDFPDPWVGDSPDPDFVMPEGNSTIDGDLALPETDDTDDWFTFEVPIEVVIPELKMTWDAPSGASIGWELYTFDPLFISLPEMSGSWFLPLAPGITEVDLTEETPEGGGPPIGTIPGGKYGIRFKTAEDPTYSITFVGQAVPEPGALVLGLLAAGGLLMKRRRRVASRLG
jgi:hypothetical protein